MKTILTLAAHPDSTDSLQLNREIRDIETLLDLATHRDDFKLVRKDAVRWDDLQRYIFRYKPRIVHFCGHGSGAEGLVLEDDQAQPDFVSAAILSDLFKQVSPYVECVLLNACYSAVQAEAIHQHINYVIGMGQPIADAAAIAYTQGFYLALGEGESVENAHNTGCRQIRAKAEDLQTSRKLTAVGEDDRPVAPANVQSATATLWKPEIFIKDPPTVFSAPATDRAAETKTEQTTGQIQNIHQGLFTLAELVSMPVVHEAVTAFRTDFRATCEQIELLAYYKSLHDLLHKVEIECYRNIVQEARRFPDDEMAIALLAEYEMALQGLIREAKRTSQQQTPLSWIAQLENACGELSAAIDSEERRPLQKAIFLMTQLLADQPVRLNTLLTSTAKALRLPMLVDALGKLLEITKQTDATAEQVTQFQDGIKALDALSDRLAQLVSIHDTWQEVDAILRRIEVNLYHDTTELEWSWLDLKEKTTPLCQADSGGWLEDFQNSATCLEEALQLNSSVKIKRHFNAYRRAALDRFSRIDVNLLEQCDELRTVGQSLGYVIGKLVPEEIL